MYRRQYLVNVVCHSYICLHFRWALTRIALTWFSSCTWRVWILGTGLKRKCLHVSPRVVIPPTFASLIALFTGAVDQLLLWKILQTLTFDSIGGLHRASSWESVASPTVALILNAANNTFGNPIHIVFDLLFLRSVCCDELRFNAHIVNNIIKSWEL
jgi:hypothetical protein